MLKFGTAGIRGIVGKDLDERFAYKLGVSLSKIFEGEFVVGHDGRFSSPSLYQSLTSGLLSNGARVHSMGLCSTPYLCFSTRELGEYGIMVTASHNPPEYNGFKVIGPEGRDILRKEEEEIEKALLSYSPPSHNYGRVSEENLEEEYLERVVSYVERKVKNVENARILYDGANGSASKYTLKALSLLGHDVISINDHVSGGFPGRLPEPSKENVSKYVSLSNSLGREYLGQDGDGDRLAVGVDGEYLIEDKVMGALILSLGIRGKVVLAINTSSSLWKQLEEEGNVVEIWKLGYLHEKLSNDVSLVSEPWKYMFPDFGHWFDGTLVASIIASEMEKFKEALRKVRVRYRENWNYKFEGDREKVFSEIVKYLKGELEIRRIINIDGIRFETDFGWLLVRLSGTEPKIRFYAEAKEKKILEDLKRNIMVKISEMRW